MAGYQPGGPVFNKKQQNALDRRRTLYEDISGSDIKKMKKLIRDVVANILRDIWLKRTVWKNPR